MPYNISNVMINLKFSGAKVGLKLILMRLWVLKNLPTFVCLLVCDGMVAAGMSRLTEVGGRVVFGDAKVGPRKRV